MIKLKNITIKIDDKEIFENFSLNLKCNQYNTLTGKNGSGKSTLIKAISNLIKYDGDIVIQENGEEKIIEQKEIGLVFQDPNDQFVRKKVIDDIAFGLENLNISRDEMIYKIKKIADEFEINHLLESDIKNLSGGEKQRVALVGVLVLQPKILILDESFIMLEKPAQKKIQRLIEKHRNLYDITIIHVTHDQEIIINSDNLSVVDKGKLIYSGEASRFYLDVINKNFIEKLPLNIELYKKLNGKVPYFKSYEDLKI